MVARAHPCRPGELGVVHMARPVVILGCGDSAASWAFSLHSLPCLEMPGSHSLFSIQAPSQGRQPVEDV